MKVLPALEFYEEAEQGDYVELQWSDGGRQTGKVEGMLLDAQSLSVHVIFNAGREKYRIGPGDRAGIITRRRDVDSGLVTIVETRRRR